MKDREKITFIIDHIDPLGQGVSKKEDQITFIPKTLPGESGIAEITKKSKGVQFAKMLELDKSSTDRIESACPHFDQCSGCDFLHTNYENELLFKEQSAKKVFSSILENIELTTHSAPRRLDYRNRIQLHYHKKIKILGYHGVKSHQIFAIDQCRVAHPSIQTELEKLLKNNHWLSLLTTSDPIKGHIEISINSSGDVETYINKKYAADGFTQVYKEMNDLLTDLVKLKTESTLTNSGKVQILDLFSGAGNLTHKIKTNNSRLWHFDIFPHQVEHGFFNVNLFEETALQNFITLTKKENLDFSNCFFIIDPPRSGFKLLNEWIKAFSPLGIIYVSCDAHTLNRDLRNITDSYELNEMHLLDLFPSTRHFESMAVLTKSL
jgi:23S rRNA (uracil1939-C5)-methyltransferase